MQTVTPKQTNESSLKQGNAALRQGDNTSAIRHYISALAQAPALANAITANMVMARQKYRAQRSSVPKPSVAVCGWELSHNAAGRVYTLAMLYETFAEVEIIGSLFPSHGREVWEPIRATAIPKHSFVVEDEAKFIDQAIQLVAAHPYDIVHLSKPRAPNIFFGILYKLIWDAKVLMDIDDEELAFVGAETPISVDDYIAQHGKLPDLKDLSGKDWTRLAVGLAKVFDGVTVCNTPLQQRYGGEIIRHARDEKLFKPSAELKRQSRDKYGIPQDKKVVLFFGTPREHKGLLETAQAIAELNRPDVLFCIVGDFADPALKIKLQGIKECQFVFLPNQPFNAIPEVVSMADCCVLIQDEKSPASQFQTPAKLSDALGMGVPVISNSSAALTDFLMTNAAINVSQSGASAAIDNILTSTTNRPDYSKTARSAFMSLISYEVHTPVLISLTRIDIAETQQNLLQKFLKNFSNELIESLKEIVHLNKNHRRLASEINNANNDIDFILKKKLNEAPYREFKDFDYDIESRFIQSTLKNKALVTKAASILVSIVMPTYNRGAIIEKAIKSVFAQTHKKWELLIIDDGSTDNTIDVLLNYKNDPRVKVIEGGHGGVSAARNKGLKEVSGEYIFYLDSDNTWSYQYLEIMIIIFLYSQRKAGYSAISLLDDDEKILGYRGEPFNWAHCLDSNYVDLNAFAHDAVLIKECGCFDEGLRRMVDWDLILRYTKMNEPFYIPFIGCNYLQGKNDAIRITLSEPKLFHKVVKIKNSADPSLPINIGDAIKFKIAIKIPAPYEKRDEWGDYHYADSLRIALEGIGHEVFIDFHGKWYERPINEQDVVIVIRGLSSYKPSKGPINILWNISHPDQVSFDEFEMYDFAFVASQSYANFLATFLKTRVRVLLQCTDPDRFSYKQSRDPVNKLLFVGNSRNEYRPIVKNAIESRQDIDVYGTLWNQFIPVSYIRGENISNKELGDYYSRYDAVLNDHWESMKVYGFVSNRIFDVLAAGGTLISDSMPSVSRLFGDAVTQINNNENFESVLTRVRTKNILNIQKRAISEYVCENHSFKNRANEIHAVILERLGLSSAYKNEAYRDFPDLKKSPKIIVGVLLQNGHKTPTSSGYIRIISPLTTEEAYDRLNLVLLENANDPALLECECIIVQRVAIADIKSAEMLIAKVKHHAIKLFVDNDDAFSMLPVTHPEQVKYRTLDSVMRYVMRNADHVWFSTPNLADLYRQDCVSASIVPNTLDPRLWRNYRSTTPRPSLVPKFRILYMGTATHDSDFAIVLPALDALFKHKGNCFKVVVIGALSQPPQREWLEIVKPPIGKTLYPKFSRWLSHSGPYDIGLAPLADDIFNSCKSDIKFLDYTALGIPTICSGGTAYDAMADLGLVLSCKNTTDQWLRALLMSLENRELMLSMVGRSWDYLWNKRNASVAASHLIADLESPRQVSKMALPLLSIVPKYETAVCLHLYYTDRWELIYSYLKNIHNSFDLYVTCSADKLEFVQELVLKVYPQAIITVVQNIGMDVLPFLQLNHDFALWRYNAVLKLHTKNDKNEDGDTIGRLYLDALLGTSNLVENVLDKMLLGSRTGMIGPEIMYRSAKKLMYGNNNITSKLLNIMDQNSYDKDWGFFAGTMFWINGSLLKPIAQKFEEIKALAMLDETSSSTGGDGTWAHAMERVFGLLPYLVNKNVFLTYIETLDGGHSQMRLFNIGELLKNPSFMNGSTAYLRRYKNLQPWGMMCTKSTLFDKKYYFTQISGLLESKIEPVIHYVIYGDCYSFNPSSHFSTNFYKKNNGDILKARCPMLVHYIINGKKEGRKIANA